jgi:hypothetical protein
VYNIYSSKAWPHEERLFSEINANIWCDYSSILCGNVMKYISLKVIYKSANEFVFIFTYLFIITTDKEFN